MIGQYSFITVRSFLVSLLAVTSALALGQPASAKAPAATYRTHVALIPPTPASSQTVRIWIDSDTALGEASGVETKIGGSYVKHLGTFDAGGYPGANWRVDLPAQPPATLVEYQLFTRNESSVDYGYSGFNWNYSVCSAVFDMNTGVSYCTIQSAIDDPVTLDGHVISVTAGIYSENVASSKVLTIVGAGNGENPALDTIVQSAAPGSGVGFALGAGTSATVRQTLKNLRVSGFSNGLVVGSYTTLDGVVAISNTNGANLSPLNDLNIQSSRFVSNAVGLRVGSAANVSGLFVQDSAFDWNTQGWFLTAGTPANASTVQNVLVSSSTFNNNLQKGLYAEKLEDATFRGITVSNSGIDPAYGFNNGIDINLKYGDYQRIHIYDSIITGSGLTGTATNPLNATAVTIKARDDAPSYNAIPATLDDVVISRTIISGLASGLRFGEFNKINAGPTNARVNYSTLSNAPGLFGMVKNTSAPVDVTCSWWQDLSGPSSTTGLNPGGSGRAISGTNTGGITLAPWLVYGSDASPAVGFQPPQAFTVNAPLDLSLAENGFRQLANAVRCVLPGQTINLSGDFLWTQPNALNSWALGADALNATDDDYSVIVPRNTSSVTITAASLGSATVRGPGDLPSVNLESFLYFDGGVNQDWTISNLRLIDLDLAIGMFNGAGGVAAYNGTRITNNFIRVPRDLNATVAPVDSNQNIGIHYSFGLNQTIADNTISIEGNGESDSAAGKFSTSVGMQSNTSGGGVYDGLAISGNTLSVTDAQDGDPSAILGIWENAHGHTSNITVSANIFNNLAGGNNPALNLQRAFRITSHSSAASSVNYSGNAVSGANIGFQWISGSDFTGNLPVGMFSNTLTNVFTGALVQSNGLGAFQNYRFTGVGGAGSGIDVASGDVSVRGSDIRGAASGVLVRGASAARLVDNPGSITGNAVGVDLIGGATTISNTSIYANGIGIRVNSATVTATQNGITNNVTAGAQFTGTGAIIATLNRNAISGNGAGAQNSTSSLVSAECNWWAAASGPGPSGPGSGDSVGPNVDYTPWLLSSDLNGACATNTVVVEKVVTGLTPPSDWEYLSSSGTFTLPAAGGVRTLTDIGAITFYVTETGKAGYVAASVCGTGVGGISNSVVLTQGQTAGCVFTNTITPVIMTVTVEPANLNNWLGAVETLGMFTVTAPNLVHGPGTPPLGVGSAALNAVAPLNGNLIGTLVYAGAPLRDINRLRYRGWNTTEMPTLQIQLDVDPSDNIYDFQGRLVFIPAATPTGVWTAYDTFSPADGLWMSTPEGGVLYAACPMPGPGCTWQQVLNAAPNARIHPTATLANPFGALMLRASDAGSQGAVDQVEIGLGNQFKVFNFEPCATPGVTNLNTSETFCTIQAAIDDGDTLDTHVISVTAGTYGETVLVNKQLTLLGPNAGIDPNTGSRGPEAIVIPDANYPLTATLFAVAANNVTIDGFIIDGDNPGLSGGVAINGVDVNAARGIANEESLDLPGNGSCGGPTWTNNIQNLNAKNNILRNLQRYGVALCSGTFTPLNGNRIDNSRFVNLSGVDFLGNDSRTGVILEGNAFAEIKDNVMTGVRRGVRTTSLAGPGSPASVTGNDITAEVGGVMINNHFGSSLVFTVSNNTIRAATPGTGNGVRVWSLWPGNSVVVQNNTVYSMNVGVQMWSTQDPNAVLVDGGLLQGNNWGVDFYNQEVFGPAPTSYATVQNVTVRDSILGGVRVRNLAAGTSPLSLVLNTSNLLNNPIGVQVDSGANAAFAALNGSANAISNNSVAGVLFSGAGGINSTLSGAPANANTFINNGAGGAMNISVTAPYLAPNVNAYWNNWNGLNLGAVENTIYHHTDDAALKLVDYFTLTVGSSPATVTADGVFASGVTANITGFVGSPAGSTIAFATDLGTLSAASASTNAAGNAQVLITSVTPGVATISASLNGITVTTQVTFVALGAQSWLTKTVFTLDSNWGILPDSRPTGTFSFVYGPATPPLGFGSARLDVAANQDLLFGTPLYTGTKLANITRLTYAAYESQASPSASLQINIDLDVTDGDLSYQGRLVSVATGIVPNTWQYNDARGGMWWSTNPTLGAICTQASQCSWGQILVLYPNIGLHATYGGVFFKAGFGPSYAAQIDNVDALVIGVNDANIAYDFEPARVYNLNTGKGYYDIQPAIDDALTLPGHVISVSASLFTGPDNVVTINKNQLTL
ncbi:MAG TPA: hypothetical protein PLG23_06945, partial [Thermoflexales bacterium]|nr:hypothetical protein [Thermoflexales bacterium]